jgi:hypothetical protein
MTIDHSLAKDTPKINIDVSERRTVRGFLSSIIERLINSKKIIYGKEDNFWKIK